MNHQKYATIVLTALVTGAAIAQPGRAEEPRTPIVRVTGEGRVSVVPDMAIVSMGVTKEGKTAREALDANTAAMADVLAAMRASGIEEKDLQTSNFSIQPQYFYPKSNDNSRQQPTINGYIVRNSLTVRVRDLSRVGDVLDASVSLGINEGGNLVFTNDDPKAAIYEARGKAVKDAIYKARTLTNAADLELGGIVEMSEQSNQRGPVPIAQARSLEMAASSEPVPVAVGENTYRVSVNVTFEIEN